MQRRFLLRLGALTPITLLVRSAWGARPSKTVRPPDFTLLARQLNQFATNIQTPADASRLVDFIADLFSEELPSAWKKSSLRNRVANAEFSATSGLQKLVPEPRLANAWNAFVDAIQAPKDHQSTPAEIHNLRDALWTTARISWDRGLNNIWAVPSIYATQPDGQLAPGCRGIESLRILWDLANMPDNLQQARDRASKGVLVSDLFRAPQKQSPMPSEGRVSFAISSNPMELAKRRYIQAYGLKAFNKAVLTMIDTTLG